jgi:hypothetical protein
LYRQLVEIHAIATMQLAEYAHWCWSDPTSSPVHAWAGWQSCLRALCGEDGTTTTD